MLQDFNALNLFAMAELNQLRIQAVDLFDRCLTEGNAAPIVAFIERQVLDDPPQIQLLHDFAEDLQQRLLSLRAYHYDVRKNVLSAFMDGYSVDIAPVMPSNDLDEYHRLDPQQVLAYAQAQGAVFSEQDLALLGKLIEISIKTAARLYSDIQLTHNLREMVLDWFEALSSTLGRRYWSERTSSQPPLIH